MNARQRRTAERLVRRYLARGGVCACLECGTLARYLDDDSRCSVCAGPVALVILESAFRAGGAS